MNKTFYINGNKDSQLKIKENSKLYNYLSDNYMIEFDNNNNEYLIIDKNILNQIVNNEIELDKKETILIGVLLYHYEYNQGYIFK